MVSGFEPHLGQHFFPPGFSTMVSELLVDGSMQWNRSSIRGLFGTGGLKCTVGLVCRCISTNVTKLNCTLEIQGVD